MSKPNLLKISILGIGFSLLSFSAMALPPIIELSVRSEPVGADIIYHYTLTHRGPEELISLTIGVEPTGYGDYLGTLDVLPVGSRWVPGTGDFRLWEVPELDPVSTTQPTGWRASASGLREEGPSALTWTSPWPANLAETYAAQPTYNFSVRVPAGPASAKYATGIFRVEYKMIKTKDFYAPIGGVLDTTPPTLSVTLSPSTVTAASPDRMYVVPPSFAVTATITVADNVDTTPRVRLDSITLDGAPFAPPVPHSLDGGPLTQDQIVNFGVDDEAFTLPLPSRAAVYVVTYSATDGSGNKRIVTGRITVTAP